MKDTFGTFFLGFLLGIGLCLIIIGFILAPQMNHQESCQSAAIMDKESVVWVDGPQFCKVDVIVNGDKVSISAEDYLKLQDAKKGK